MSAGTILMVEPNPGILIVARNVLSRAGFSVLAVADARRALDLARRRPIHLFVLDGRQTDPEVCRGLAAIHGGPLPVILTLPRGGAGGGLHELGLPEIELAEVLEKPFAPERLLRAVERILDGWSEHTEPFVDALGGEGDADERLQTDVFPFAALLQSTADPTETLFDDETKLNSALDRESARLGARIREVAREEGVELSPELLALCVRVCRASVGEVGAAGTSGVLALSGSLELLAVDQILQLGAHVDAPARCRLEHEGAAIDIYYRGSEVVFARQVNLPGGFMLGRLLIAQGVVSEADVERALRQRVTDVPWVGQRLVAAGLLDRRALAEALRLQTEELVYELVRWNRGRFAVFAREQLPAQAEQARISVPVQHLLLEGMRRFDEWQRIAGEVGGMSTILGRAEHPSGSELLAALSPAARQVLEHVDGQRTVGEVVRAVARPTFDVFRALSTLAGQRLVTVTARGSA